MQSEKQLRRARHFDAEPCRWWKSRDERTNERNTMDSLPDLRQKNTNEGISGHCAGEIPAVLLHMQERNPNQCGADEDGCKRRARRLEHRACFSGAWGCRPCLCNGLSYDILRLGVLCAELIEDGSYEMLCVLIKTEALYWCTKMFHRESKNQNPFRNQMKDSGFIML